jgi:hypothetical protein
MLPPTSPELPLKLPLTKIVTKPNAIAVIIGDALLIVIFLN